MDLLQFARGPALQWSLFILVLGTLWRLTGLYLLKRARATFPSRAIPRPWRACV